MNLYHCQIDLKDDAKALIFAQALEAWMRYLQEAGTIQNWRLLRRKLNLVSAQQRDFMLEIEVEDLSQLDKAFRLTGKQDETVERLHKPVHDLIASADFSLYRPFPDPERSERMALL